MKGLAIMSFNPNAVATLKKEGTYCWACNGAFTEGALFACIFSFYCFINLTTQAIFIFMILYSRFTIRISYKSYPVHL